MKRIAKFLIPLLGLTWMSFHFGCQTLSTTAGAPPSGSVNGMLYYLPIGKITIKGEFKPLPSPTPTASTAQATTPTEPHIAAESSASPSSSGNPIDGGAQPPAGGGQATSGTTISAGELTITLTPDVEADESAGEFYVVPLANYVYEDEARVTVNSKQLLSTGNVTTEDKTADIVGTLASIAAQAQRGGFFFRPQGKEEKKKSRLPFYFSFHPSKRDEVRFVTEQLSERDIGFAVPTAAVSEGKQVGVGAAEARRLGKNGLIFRPATSYKITLTFSGVDRDDPDQRKLPLIKSTQQFVLPDPNRLYEIEYPRMAFVKKVKEIGFTNGMLTDFHQRVPSPILGFLGIPKAVLQAIVPIPGAPAANGGASGSGTTPPKS